MVPKATYSIISAFKSRFVLHKHDLRSGAKKVSNLEVLSKISFSFSPPKQKRWLKRFVVSLFAKFLRYEMGDFQGQRYKNNSTKNQDQVHSMNADAI